MPSYYTPTVEDLVWGLEYYEMYTDGTWNPQILLEHNRDVFLEFKSWPTSYRIKHLDGSDILELGWKSTTGIISTFILGEYRLLINDWSDITISDSKSVIFTGQCRNKAELKRLMNNLSITAK